MNDFKNSYWTCYLLVFRVFLMCILSFDPKNTRRYLGKSGISHCSHEEIKAPQACVTTKDALARGCFLVPKPGFWCFSCCWEGMQWPVCVPSAGAQSLKRGSETRGSSERSWCHMSRKEVGVIYEKRAEAGWYLPRDLKVKLSSSLRSCEWSFRNSSDLRQGNVTASYQWEEGRLVL